ncbi:MAG: phosphoadenosine phosphosulfate reductase family protein [Bacteroidota bacterium]
MKENYIVSMSGGKDSTAMLLLMLEKGERVHSVVTFDTGWEFPAMHSHIDKLEAYTEIPFVRLSPKKPFTYWMFEREIVAKKGDKKGQVHRIGNGWPSPMRRWCTRLKVDSINNYVKTVDSPVSCVGYAADEAYRLKSNSKIKRRYPLIEYGIDEDEALKICKSHGFHWDGLYNIFSRVSCFCCPLQSKKELRKLRRHYPELWQKMLYWDSMMPGHNRGFRGYSTVHDMEKIFKAEDQWLRLPGFERVA